MRLAAVGIALGLALLLPPQAGAGEPRGPEQDIASAAAKRCRFAPPISAKNVGCGTARRVARRYQELVASGFCLSGDCRVGKYKCRFKQRVPGIPGGRVRCKSGRKTIRFNSG